MDWYYAINGRRYGPVSETQMEELRRTGEVRDDTLVWRSGLADWRALGDEFPQVSPKDRICSECRGFFLQSEMICVNRAWICAECKPMFLQRLSEGVASSLGVGELWRKDRLVIFHAETAFPDRCIRCNAAANGYRLRCQLYWAPTGRVVLSHHRVAIQVALCGRHRRQRHRTLAGCWLAILMGIGVIMASRLLPGGFLILAGLALILFGLLAVAHFSSLVAATQITDGVVRMRGAGKAFLAELPEWTGD